MTDLTTTETSRILRFNVPVDDAWHLVKVPRNGVLGVGCRIATSVDFWMRERDSGTEARAYRAYGTGQPIPAWASHEGTCVAPGGQFVWHLMSATAAPPVG